MTTTSSQRRLKIWIAAGLALATLALYAPVRHFEFVNYDDPSYVVENEVVSQGLSREGLEWALASRVHGHWHPLTWLSHMADVELFGLEPGGHHLSSLLLHVATTLLLFAFLARATGAVGRSAVVAGLFSLHPLHVESVAWISDRKDLLAGFFFVLTLLAYLRYCATPGWLRYALLSLSFAAGLLAKSMVITLPALLLLLDFWPLGRWPAPLAAEAAAAPRRQRRLALARLLGEKVFLLAVAAAVGLVAVDLMVGEFAEGSGGSLFRRAAIDDAVVFYALYLAKTLVPVGLVTPYSVPDFAFWQSLLAEILLLVITVPVIIHRRRLPALFTGWFWFLLTLLPVIGLLENGPKNIADRYTYIPLTGLFLAGVWGVAELSSRLARRLPSSLLPASSIPVALAGAALLACATLSSLQLRHWRNSEALFSHAVAVSSGNHTAYVGLAGGALDQGRVEEAIEHLREALRIAPEDLVALRSLGMILFELERFEEAVVPLQQCFELEPRLPDLAGTLGATQEKLGNLAEALRAYQSALWLEPSADNHYKLGRLAKLRGEPDEEIFHYQQALRFDPGHEQALEGLFAGP